MGSRWGRSPPDDKAGGLIDELLRERVCPTAKMIVAFFPMKKLQRNGKYLLLGAILLVGAVAVYHEMLAAKSWSGDRSMNPEADSSSWNRDMLDENVRRNLEYVLDSAAWSSSYMPQTWKPEYKGQANLHVYEDWCGSSTDDLRKNQHYPLYPHSRTTVQKLAVSPQWTNYGLRIFGYLHPYTDGEFVFALSSDDNSELWLSTDDLPLNVQLLAWVGKTGREWTVPGEFEKYASQTSRPVWLSAQRKYFFEVIHKQNDKGTDHVEVAWKLLDQDFRFMVIESKHISLYVNESALLMSDVAHIPQTAASHKRPPTKQHSVTADMLREEPRDTIYQVPLVDTKVLRGVLPDCSYQPSYTIKDFPLIRYQGLQFVHMSYVYPNDYTRLTHMESENTCFYPENPLYMKMFGFSRYMRLDRPDSLGKGKIHREFGDHRRKIVLDEEDEFDKEAYEREKEARPDQIDNALFPDYGDDYDDYVQRRRRKLFSLVKQETNNRLNSSDTSLHIDQLKEGQWKDSDPLYQLESKKPTEPQESVQRVTVKLVETSGQQKNLTEFKQNGTFNKVEQIKPKRKKSAKKRKLKLVETTLKQLSPQSIPEVRGQFNAKGEPIGLSEQPTSKPHRKPRSYRTKPKQTFQELGDSNLQPLERGSPLSEKPQVVEKRKSATSQMEIQQLHTTLYKDTYPKFNERDSDSRKRLRDKEMEINMPLQDDLEKDINRTKTINRVKVNSNWSDTQGEDDEAYNRADNRRATREGERDTLWGPEEDFEGVTDEDLTPAPVFDTEVNWSQTFQVSHLDLQSQRSDWIDLSCNISGNLLLHSSDALSMVKAFMDQLNEKHHGRFKLMRVVNVIKRVDGIQGSRYFLELELKDANGQLLRLSQYVYALIRHSRQRSRDFRIQRSTPELLLCNPVGFRWNPLATVHFIVPVKNQARWVLQLIADMEKLFRVTGDTNFNLIITDYNSTDMDVRKVLQKSSLPRYEYIKLGGNFERSAGLQAGVNLINDNHSIVFLCDLHIHFPPSIIDTIRKHCVEGYMAFAPIVMRLNCGATPLDARGFWEVNGFGLLGIYKSDLDAVGGMNTKEFTDRWGGEDWELLDRILQAGLEVERIHLRNFFHHYHSKRGMWNRRMSPSHG